MRLSAMCLCLVFLGIVMASSPRFLEAQTCDEACYTIVDQNGRIIGNACVLGPDGWDCNAGTHYCSINLCEGGGVPEALLSTPDGKQFYAYVPCGQTSVVAIAEVRLTLVLPADRPHLGTGTVTRL